MLTCFARLPDGSFEAWSFWVVLGGMGALAAALLAYFRTRRWV